MRLVVWNCAMALHAKWDRLTGLRPDVAIVPECADPTIIWTRRKAAPDCDALWIGDNPNKGLGVFAFPGYSLQRDDSYDPRFKQFLPVSISGAATFALLAVWAFNHRTKPAPASYGAATMAAIDHYEGFLVSGRSIVAGDFNNSTVWDRKGRPGNFAAIAARFGEMGLASAYHERSKVAFGAELEETHFWRKGPSEFHIDYCFLPRSWPATSATVGSREEWIGVSDHAPLVVECTEIPNPVVQTTEGDGSLARGDA